MTRKPIRELILVYASGSGVVNTMMDSAKKILMIQGCALCAITHGILGEKRAWKSCKDELGIPIKTYHVDELPDDIAALVANEIPCVIARTDKESIILLKPDVLKRCRGSVSDFKGRLLFYAAVHNLYIPGLHMENPSTEKPPMLTKP